MGNAFDFGVERLTGTGVPGEKAAPPRNEAIGRYMRQSGGTDLVIGHNKSGAEGTAEGVGKYRGEERGTFYLETFGCQMNEHDSEKVAGVLLARGYKQVERTDQARLILYNTCSIREKAAQ